MEKIVDRFLRYVAFDTTSNPDSQSQPSTNKQFALLEQLRKELVAMGLENVELDKYGYLMASIPSNILQHRRGRPRHRIHLPCGHLSRCSGKRYQATDYRKL